MKRMALFIGSGETAAETLWTASRLAARAGARIDVFAPPLAGSSVVVFADGMAVASDPAVAAQQGQAIAQAFREVCGVNSTARLIHVGDAMDEAILRYGFYYDLLILERLTVEEGPSAKAFNAALFDCAAPVLVAPPAAPSAVGRIAAVVWTGTAQSARALRSALPLLAVAKQVYLLTNAGNTAAAAAPVMEYLGIHGIDPDALSFDGTGLSARGRGRAIIEVVRSISADLMVMGAFGDNALDALFGLGRTTRKLVTAAPIPLLLQS